MAKSNDENKIIEFRTKVRKLLGHVNKQLEKADGPPSLLWRMVLGDLNIDFNRWNTLMLTYLYTFKTENEVTSPIKISDERGKITKALTNERMSLKTFLRGLWLLQVEKADFTFKVYLPDGQVLTQSATLLYDSKSDRGRLTRIESLGEGVKSKKLKFGRVAARPKMGYDPDLITTPIMNMLNDDIKQAHRARGVLSRIWRLLLCELDYDVPSWNNGVVSYLGRCNFDPLERGSKKRSNVRGNLNKELIRPDMTIWVFLKALAFLGATKMDMQIVLKRKGITRLSLHEISYDIPTPDVIFQQQESKRSDDAET